ncbi:MAG: capsular polysaccharide biosynthesis protein [Bacillus sp. (in: firmicutes)]|nr:capsular polysaccharide biosynthesis protein [Bacillus sp. (in: firmicutes)]
MKPLALNKRRTIDAGNKRNLVAHTHPESIISEQFRTIQTNITLSSASGGNRIFLITSPNSGEGKSTTAVNLAISLASQKRKVLLIDANLRNPSAHIFFRSQNKLGLTNVLSGRVPLEEAVTTTDIGRLEVLTSGPLPLNPVELLGSYMMQELLEMAHQSYDLVIIDSPSVLEVTDSKLLADHCDGVILVINRGRTQLEDALEAKKELAFAKAKIIGVILNE